ncbi:RNA polymerase subunit sigma [Aliirhizobium terrae]|uniref:sigma factor n=1 Tax=Terrirhizobium terrae TaxID=2926709 RepID=UPI002576954D|nr:sigma factor [Rhizobium sp. CC-CFT758]WJH41982.1 RNA polymerase subunit sigma [Rhizobium sp. CC-CFT758]
MNTREQSWAKAMCAERRGERLVYETFLREFAVSLRHIARARLARLHLSAAEAEDVVQDVLIAVHSKRDQWDPSRPLMPWLNAITRYKMIDTARRLRRDVRLRIELTDDEWSDLSGSDGTDPVHNAADVERMISALPRASSRWCGQSALMAHRLGKRRHSWA